MADRPRPEITDEGVYLSGSIRQADPQICVWVANVPNPDTQLTTSRIAGRDGSAPQSHLS